MLNHTHLKKNALQQPPRIAWQKKLFGGFLRHLGAMRKRQSAAHLPRLIDRASFLMNPQTLSTIPVWYRKYDALSQSEEELLR